MIEFGNLILRCQQRKKDASLRQNGRENMQNKYLHLEEISQPGAFSQYDINVLADELEKLSEPSKYLEIGVWKGKSLSVAKLVTQGKDIKICGIDIASTPELDEYLKENLDIDFYLNDSVVVAESWKEYIDVIFIDGDHSYEGCRRDIDAWFPHMR